MVALFKNPPLRDEAWLDYIRGQNLRCAVTGRKGAEGDYVVPAHVGVAGKGIKSPDNEVIPMLDSEHMASHSQAGPGGDCTYWCNKFQEDPLLLRDVLKAYARELHSKFKACNV